MTEKKDKQYFRENFFQLVRYRVSADKREMDEPEETEATVKILVPEKNAKGKVSNRYKAEYQPEDGKYVALSATASGDGVVDALDQALRLALVPIYSFLKEVKLIRYSVENTSFKDGTSAEVEVFILASNKAGKLYFSEVRSRSVVEASFFALANIYNRYYHDEQTNGKRTGGKK